jgi:hypothetical protein
VSRFFRSLFRSSPPPPEAPAAADGDVARRLSQSLVTLALELWRVETRLARLGEAERASLRTLRASFDKMNEALASLGLRVDAPTGTWDERDPVKVLLFEPTAGLTRARIAEVVKPTIYIGESILAHGEVVVAVPEGDPRAHHGGEGS